MSKHFLLFYDYAADVLERRPQFRGAHLKHAWAAVERGEILVAGALADPVDGAVLMFSGEDKSIAEKFAKADPYVAGGLVERWHVREWTTVVGDLAATPVPPELA
ncbi:YciI-like protein [Sphingomonas hankyongi]|uniref:YciI-like protein n=1 Tax=Sphingomonas hankyongi TaxID=2908209 RepID=A0ABT0S536_9SPHN|nr:YciI-like protein [Sphingomonas hankyongi]MCL6730982.1 YciI-like protein [Sphingomonas hankyongi]